MKKRVIFGLILILALSFCIIVFKICESKHSETPTLIVSENKNLSNSDVNQFMILISDNRSYSPTQIIHISDSTIKHGFATVVYPFDELESKDIFWEHSYSIDGDSYPITERKLSQEERTEVKRIIMELQTHKFEDPYSYTDDYVYILYINGHKITSAYTRSYEERRLPIPFQEILTEIFTMSEPLYPNQDILLHE